MQKYLRYLWCFLILLPDCSDAENYPTVADRRRQDVSTHIAYIQALSKKKVFEFVRIDGVEYLVPVPWRGRKIMERPPRRTELQQIPLEFSRYDMKLFMEKEACDQFVRMATKAREDNVHLIAHSGYRSIHSQKRIFRELMSQGRSWDDLVRYVAPPAYSEHMLGTVVDLYPSDWQFASTIEYAWLQEHASTFGFTETYPESGKNGFHWEPWHWKYTAPQETWKDR